MSIVTCLMSFMGAVLVTGSGYFDLGWPIFCIFLSAFFASLTITLGQCALKDVTTEKWSTSLGFVLYGAAFCLFPALSNWSWPEGKVLGNSAAAALLSVAIQGIVSKAFSQGDVQNVAPFDFLRLFVAVGIDVALLGAPLLFSTACGEVIIFAMLALQIKSMSSSKTTAR